MAAAVLHALKHRSKTLTFDGSPSLKGYRIQPHIAARILELYDNDDLDAALLVEECLGVIDVVEALAGEQDIKVQPLSPDQLFKQADPVVVSNIVAKLKDTHQNITNKPKSPFIPEFVQFLKTGDISVIAPSGKMTPEMFKATKHYIFADVIRVNGKTIQASFFSNPAKGLVLISPELEVQVGKCVLINSNGVLTGYITEIPNFVDRANTFNATAARSKV